MIQKNDPTHPTNTRTKSEIQYNGVRKQCKNCLEYHREKRTEDTIYNKLFTFEKKSFEQYEDIFKENNPQVLKLILEIQNQKAEYNDDMESNSEFTKEINNIKDEQLLQ